MKRFVVFLFLSLFTSDFYSQVALTNGFVYNYSVGDTIEYFTQANGGPPISYTVSYLQKTVKVDTFIYQIKQQHYQPPSCMTCSASAGITTYTYQVTDLNANAAHFALTNTVCTNQYDSSYVNGCGQLINFRETRWGSTCFEPDMFKSYLIEGVGLFFEYTYGQDINHYTNSKTLTYYHKLGQSPCGGNGMPLGIELIPTLSAISVYPNPVVNENIHIIKGDETKVIITILSLEGKLMYQTETKSKVIEIAKKFAPGLYFVRFQSTSGASLVKKLIIE